MHTCIQIQVTPHLYVLCRDKKNFPPLPTFCVNSYCNLPFVIINCFVMVVVQTAGRSALTIKQDAENVDFLGTVLGHCFCTCNLTVKKPYVKARPKASYISLGQCAIEEFFRDWLCTLNICNPSNVSPTISYHKHLPWLMKITPSTPCRNLFRSTSISPSASAHCGKGELCK